MIITNTKLDKILENNKHNYIFPPKKKKLYFYRRLINPNLIFTIREESNLLPIKLS